MLSYIRGFLALFVLVTLLVSMVPEGSFKKYIRFFAEVILTFSFLSPVLSIICDSDEFLELIRYEEFTESLSEISRDTQRMEFIRNDYYIDEYETAIGEDVKQIAEQYGFTVQSVNVKLNDDYTLNAIHLSISDKKEQEVLIGKITLEDGALARNHEGVYAGLKQELANYYQLEEGLIDIRYEG